MKKTTKDDYFQSVYKVVHYIEMHYAEELDLDLLAKLSGFSKYHFHRIFLSIVGTNLNAFIRKVRLSKSTGKLANGLSVTEVAMQSGYETPASFAKAFKERFGFAPKEFSKKYRRGEKSMNIEPKIVEFEETKVLYVRSTGDYMLSSGKAWEVLMSFAYAQKIKHKKNIMGKDAMMFGIGHDCPETTPAEDLRYDACISYDDASVEPEGEIGVKHIQGGKCLCYMHKGSFEGVKDVYAKMMDYVIQNELTMSDNPAFEKYYNRDPRRTKPENLRTEIYIPIEG